MRFFVVWIAILNTKIEFNLLLQLSESRSQRSLMDHLSKNLRATQPEKSGLKGNDVEVLPNQDYIDKINELHHHLDMVNSFGHL